MLVLLLLTSCTSRGPAIESAPVVIDAGCLWSKPIYVSRTDLLSEGTAEAILIHNETWQRRCQQKTPE